MIENIDWVVDVKRFFGYSDEHCTTQQYLVQQVSSVTRNQKRAAEGFDEETHNPERALTTTTLACSSQEKTTPIKKKDPRVMIECVG